MRKMLMLLLVMCMLLSGCSEIETPVSQSDEVKDDPIKIGMSFDSFVIERWQRDRDVFVSTAQELGAQVNVQSANGDVEKQKEQIEYFIESGMDVIVIICIDSGSLSDVVSDARRAGIKVIAYDRLLNDSAVDLYISFDNEMVGRMMGEALCGAIDYPGSFVMLGGSPKDNNVSLLEQGFLEVCEENSIDVSGRMHADNWKAEIAAEYVYNNEDIIKSASGIMCGNDTIAGAVIPVLAEMRLAGSMSVVGQDADLEACQRIVEGTQLMTVYKPVEKLAKRAASCAIALAKGEKLEAEDVQNINDGTYDVPYIAMEPISVTKDNMNEVIIGSGFHLKEDVYLNVPELMPA
ncbi:MAG: substrate-binding domain-containing protein [Lachnospiraceae bacterium]|nr:substrate-binding domain-containing protein [Lachnospiraceae bacterium]